MESNELCRFWDELEHLGVGTIILFIFLLLIAFHRYSQQFHDCGEVLVFGVKWL